MIFQSAIKYAPIKAVIISASNCTGKSFALRLLTSEDYFKRIKIFEMDATFFYKKDMLQKQLPIAWEKFDQWLGNLDNNSLLDELLGNIKASGKGIQLVKLQLIDLMNSPGQFITVLPAALRHTHEGIRFIQMLEEQFKKRIVHLAIIPNLTRYLVNFINRKKIFNFRYITRSLKERRLLLSKASAFDAVIRMHLRAKNNDYITSIFKNYL